MAYDQIHIVDATSQMIEVALRSSSTGQLLTGKAYGDMTIKYQREGAAAATTVSVVTATKGSYTSGGFVETDIAGLYQFGIPTGALATGAKAVTLTFACTGALDVVKRIVLISADLRNVTSLGLSNLDAAVSTRSTYAGGDTSGVTTLLGRIVGTLAAGTHNPQAGDAFTRLGVAGAGLTAIGDTRIANLDAAVSSRSTFAGGAVASVTGNVGGNVVGSVASVTAPVTAGTVSDKTGYALSSAGVQAIWDALTSALNAYDPPTNTEMEARTLAAANYATATVLDAVGNFVDTEVAAIKAVTDKLDTALVLDGAVYQLTANALELAPTGSGSGATAEEVWEYAGGTGRTINSVLGTVSAQLADGVVHGGTTAELTLKKAVLSNTSNQGIALSLRGGNPASPGHAIALLDENGTLGTGRIRGYIDGVVNGVALATEAITDAAFDATGLQAVADALKLAPTAGDPATGSVYDLLVAPASEPAQLDWRAWSTPSGALAALYDTNAIDDLTHSGTTLTAEGDTGFAAWVLQEFDGKLFVGVGKTPMNHIAAVVGSIASAGETPTFEYALPEEGVAAMCVSWEDKLYVAGVDERANTGDSSIYIRTAAGTWTRKATVTGWQHICGIRHDGALWIAGQGAASILMRSDDDGDTWIDTDLTLGRAYDVIRLGSYVIATHWDGDVTYTVHRSPTVPAFSWAPVSGIEGGTGRMVEWEGVIVGVSNTGKLFTVNSGGTGTEYTPPFTPRQTYNNLAVDTDGYLCVLGQTGVWRTNDLANWKQVWSFSPADTVRSLGTWGDDLVVSTDGATAQVLARPASPEAAQQQMYRDALKLAASPGTAEAGSTDANIDAIRLITDAIDTSAVTVTSSNNAGVLTFTRGVTFAATVSGLTISATWAKLYFTLKESDYDTDDMALLQLVESNPGVGTDGLLYLNSAALVLPIAATDGTLTVSQAAGTVAIAITDNAMAQLSKASGLVWDIKTKDAAGNTVQNTTGTASILRAVTQTI